MISYDYHFKVRYKDIDQMGVMYYSRYFEYYEAARTDMMRTMGLTYKALEGQGIMMPVVHSESDYMAGPRFDDYLTCRTTVHEIHRNKMEIFYEIFQDNAPETIINRGQTVHAFLKMNGRPTRMPESLKNVLEQKWQDQS